MRYTGTGSFDVDSFTGGVTDPINVDGFDIFTFQLNAFATDAMAIEGSLWNDTWNDVKFSPHSTVGVDIISTTAEGFYQVDVRNLHEVRFALTGSSSPAWTGQWAASYG